MQKNVPKYTPDWVRTVRGGRRRRSATCPTRVQRPAHAAVVREPARGRVPPTLVTVRVPIASPTSCSTSTRPRVATSRRSSRWRASCARRWPTSGSPARSRPAGRRACTCSSRSTTRRARGLGRRDRASRRGPSGSTRAGHDRVHEGRSRGKVFVDSTRVGGATVVAAYSPRVRPGAPVSFPVAWDDLDDVAPGRLHRAHRARPARRRRPVGGAHGRAATPDRRPDRRGHAIPVARVQAMHDGKRATSSGATERGRRTPPPNRGAVQCLDPFLKNLAEAHRPHPRCHRHGRRRERGAERSVLPAITIGFLGRPDLNVEASLQIEHDGREIV